MNDKTIISTISKIYFIITSFFLFIFLTLCVIFVILQNGLYIDEISLPNLKIKQLYIKWNEKLNISIKETKITAEQNNNDKKLDYSAVYENIQRYSGIYKIFEEIIAEKILFNDITASFKYSQKKDGYIVAISPTLELKSILAFDSETLNLKINKFSDSKRDLTLDGNIVFSSKTKDATASIRLNIHNDISLQIYANADKEKFFYKINSLKDIKSITHTMELLNLHEGVKYWAYKAIEFSSLHIDKIYGWGEFENLQSAYLNLYASAKGDNLTYKYNANLDAIHTKSTRVEFKGGVLYIRPELPKSYNSNLGKSWLKIDFTKKEELLTLYLLFEGKLDKETLGVLKQYEIDVPFLQNSGTTKTNLTLTVNLRNIKVDAKGDFFSKKANFRYQGFDIDIYDAYIILDNYDVKINNMLAKYEDIIEADVDVRFDAKLKAGSIDLDVKKFEFKDAEIKLNTTKAPLKVRYQLSALKDKIEIANSSWEVYSNNVDIEKIALPFNLDTLKIEIPKTKITSKNTLNANVSGSADFKKLKFDLDIELQKMKLENFELTKSPTPIKLKYDEGLSLLCDKTVSFKTNSIESFLSKPALEYKNNILSIKDTYINVGNILKTKLSAKYHTDKKTGSVETKYIKLVSEELGSIYSNNQNTNFSIYKKDGKTTINSKELKMSLAYSDEFWKVDINSISPIARDSEILQKYKIKKGSISLHKKMDEDDIYLNSKLTYPYKVLVKENLELENYFIKGQINTKNKKTFLNINESVKIAINDDIDISMKEVGINLNEIANILEDINSSSKKQSDTNINIEAKDSYLYISKNRRIISQEMYLQYYKKALTAQLKHKSGLADLKFENNMFYAYGEDFNDDFMENLFALSKFKGGKFEFRISGTPQEYDGIFTLKDTVIIDYKILNNILAFVNTVPSLVTFALPGYSTSGLRAKEAYMKFSSKDALFDISDIYLNSKEVDILGHGKADIKNNTVDMELNLKTDIGSKFSKIPLVGYLLMDKDSISTTLSISGDLNDPKIKSLLAKEIVVAPLNILKRAINLPYDFIKSFDKNSTKEE